MQLINGLFGDTPTFSEPVAAAHIDGDWYDAVRICLARAAPHVLQSRVLTDDYDACWGGHHALDHFLAVPPNTCSPRQRSPAP
jgi:hypothetical protein